MTIGITVGISFNFGVNFAIDNISKATKQMNAEQTCENATVKLKDRKGMIWFSSVAKTCASFFIIILDVYYSRHEKLGIKAAIA